MCGVSYRICELKQMQVCLFIRWVLLNYKKDVYCTRDVSIRNDVLQPKVICQFKTIKGINLFIYLSAQGQVRLFLFN
jgi:hypothetical protein